MAGPGLVKKCCNCRSDLPENSGSIQCEKCQKNEARYGKPTSCKFCKLPAAFHEEKCVHCAYAERKFGSPVACANCKLKAAFNRDPKHKEKPVLCRMCICQARANKQTELAGVQVNARDQPSSSSHKHAQKRKKNDKEEESTSKNAKRDPLGDSGENVLVVQQLRDQITKLSQEIAKRDQVILEKDKKIASLKADLMNSEKKSREKIQQLSKERDETINQIHDKYRAASKQAKAAK